MKARPTREPPATTRRAVRTTSPEELLRCSRMKLSGTWIDGRKVASRGPWNTAVSRGRACPTPAGFASRTTFVSTRLGPRLGADLEDGVLRGGIAELACGLGRAAARVRLGQGRRRRRVLADRMHEGDHARPARVDQDLPLLLLLRLEEAHDPVGERHLALREPAQRGRTALGDHVPRGVVGETGDAREVLGLGLTHAFVVGETRARVGHARPGLGIHAVDDQEAPRQRLGRVASRRVLDERGIGVGRRHEERGREHERRRGARPRGRPGRAAARRPRAPPAPRRRPAPARTPGRRWSAPPRGGTRRGAHTGRATRRAAAAGCPRPARPTRRSTCCPSAAARGPCRARPR